MRERKHERVVNKKRKSRYQPLRRRSMFLNFAIATAILMALSLAIADFGRRSSPPSKIDASSAATAPGDAEPTTRAPASVPSVPTGPRKAAHPSGS